VEGEYEVIFIYDQLLLATGFYSLVIGLSNHEATFHYVEEATTFEIQEVKDENIINDQRVLKTSGTGFLINPIKASINKLS
jgi:hypothetical protein